jgi:hypothetical protein
LRIWSDTTGQITRVKRERATGRRDRERKQARRGERDTKR